MWGWLLLYLTLAALAQDLAGTGALQAGYIMHRCWYSNNNPCMSFCIMQYCE